MADATIHGIEFEIKGSSDAAVKSIERLSAALNKIKKATSGGLGMSKIAGELQTLNNAIQNTNFAQIAAFSAALKTIGRIKINNRFAKGISDISKAVRELNPGNLTRVTEALSSLASLSSGKIDADGLATLTEYLKQISQIDFTNLTNAAYALREISEATGKFNPGDAGSGATEAAEKQVSAWSRVKEALLGVIKFGGRAIALPFKKMGTGIAGVASKVGNLSSSLKRVAFYRLIRSAIKAVTDGLREGINNAYQWSKVMGGPVSASGMTLAESLDDMATSLKYFKNGIGAASAPLISALAPAIRVATDAAVEFLNIINQVIALLTGQSGWTRATRQAQEYEEAVGGAGGAAKEALRYLAPFDELNVLPSQKQGGGGGGAEDYGGMFEEMEQFEQGIIDFADRIKKAIEDSDWEGLGALLGGKINEILDRIDFAELGAQVGAKINALFTTQYWTLDEINFQNIGASVARFLNNALDNIDFNIIGRSFTQTFTNLFDIAIGFINELDFGELATSISNYILGAIQELTKWIKEVDWTEFMHNLVQGIIDFISNMQIGEILVAIGDLFVAISDAVFDLAKALVLDLIDVFKNPDTWTTLWAWFDDYILRGFVQFGINLVNAIGDVITDGLNALISAWNDSDFVDFLREQLGWDWAIEPIEFKLIADLDPPVGELYKQKKAEIEAASADSPVGLNMQGVLDEIQSTLPEAKTEVPVVGVVSSISDVLSERDRMIDTTAHYTRTDGSALTSGQRLVSTTAWLTGINGGALKTADRMVATVALFRDVANGLTAEQRTLPTTSMFRWVDRSKLSASQRTIETTSLFKWVDRSALSVTQKTIEIVGKFIRTNFSSLTQADRTVDATAKFFGSELAQSIKDPWGRLRIAATADIRGATGMTTITMVPQADGGAYFGNAWHSIPQFASGGRPHGSIFIAGEAGAEIVGNVGNRTEVLNRSQIASAIYAAVKSAMIGLTFRMESASYVSEDSASEETMYRAFSRALADSDLGGDVELDGDVLYRAIVNRNRRNTRMTGVNAMA